MWLIWHVDNSRKLCSWKFIFNNKEMIYLSWWVWWWCHLYEHNEHKKAANFSALYFVEVCEAVWSAVDRTCRLLLTQHHFTAHPRLECIWSLVVPLNCSTRGLIIVKQRPWWNRVLFSALPRGQVSVSILSCLLGLSYKSRNTILTNCH